MMHARLFLAVALALAAQAAAAAVTAKDAWVRGTVPGQGTTGAYVTLRSTEDAKIVGVSSPAAKRAEIHRSDMQGGIMRMRPDPVVELPANRDVALDGERHVMLLDLRRALGAGESVKLVFTVEDARGKRSRVEIEAPVRPLGR
jgi:copper(I)-binding protein